MDLGDFGDPDAALGRGGPKYYTTNVSPGVGQEAAYGTALGNALYGSDIYPQYKDIRIRMTNNSDANWYFGTDGNTPNDRIDFVTIARDTHNG